MKLLDEIIIDLCPLADKFEKNKKNKQKIHIQVNFLFESYNVI